MSIRPFEVIWGLRRIDFEILKDYPMEVPGDVALEAPDHHFLCLSFGDPTPCNPESLRLE
jgi:hypothetical protein